MRISTRVLFRPKEPSQTGIPYLEGLENFAEHYRDEDLRSETVADLTQLYVFQVHNYFKKRWHNHLCRLSSVSVMVSLVYVILAYIVARVVL
jgi:hypothetical protein